MVNRTALLPKEGKDPAKAENWRPITISSHLARVFSSLIESRLKAKVELCGAQRGFTRSNGCYENTILINQALKRMKVDQGGVAVQINISKAFDTVPHPAIKSVLLGQDVHPILAGFIAKQYDDPVIRTGGEEPVKIVIKRRVKQGDPLSPLLFNLVLDPILRKLGIHRGTKNSKLLSGGTYICQ